MLKFIANFPSMAGTRIAKITGSRKSVNLNTGDVTIETEVKVLGDRSQGESDWQEYYTESAAENLGLVRF